MKLQHNYRHIPTLCFKLLALISMLSAPCMLAAETFAELTILVPAERGGGWDLTAKAMAETLRHEGLVDSVSIEYSPGAGGLIGLAQFVSSSVGKDNVVLIGGMFTVGAAVQNRAAISLLDTLPLARLTRDNTVVAVPSESKIRSASDLIEALHSAPESISWVGGSRAGVDEINLYEMARALGVAASRLHYTGLPGGGEVGTALISGKFHAGISGYSEFEELVEANSLRVIAVASENNLDDIGAPSFAELGIRIERYNWRGVFAPPGINEQQFGVLADLISHMVASDHWQRLLWRHHWQDAYLAGEEFREYVRAEQSLIVDELARMKESNPDDRKVINSVLLRRYSWALGLALLSLLLVSGLCFQRWRGNRREAGLQLAYEKATGEATLRTEELEKALAGIHAHIEKEFDQWQLTLAEREIALLLLKGLRLKDIAEARGTSERTVRQQAQAVYKKARLDGRFELAAYFIEDVMESMELSQL